MSEVVVVKKKVIVIVVLFDDDDEKDDVYQNLESLEQIKCEFVLVNLTLMGIQQQQSDWIISLMKTNKEEKKNGNGVIILSI